MWVDMVQKGVKDWLAAGGKLGQWHRQGIKQRSKVIWWEGGELRMGEVMGTEAEETWQDEVTVELWQRDRKGAVVKGGWQDDMAHLQIWEQGKGEEQTVQSELVWPVHTNPISSRGQSTRQWIDEDEIVVKQWRTMEEAELWQWEEDHAVWHCGKQEQTVNNEDWDFEGKADFVGWYGDADLIRVEIDDMLQEARDMHAEGKWVQLESYSDGSMKGKGAATKGTYGWLIRGIKGGKRRTLLRGGGIMRGDPMHLQSTRCENAGTLAAVIAVIEIGWQWDWHHMLPG